MIEFELYIEEQFVYTSARRADHLDAHRQHGVFALGRRADHAPGPGRHRAGADVPHTLGSRPLVIHGSSSIRIVINEYNELHPSISCDGQLNITASPGDIDPRAQEARALKLLHPLDHNFYAICRAKLGWGSRPDGDE